MAASDDDLEGLEDVLVNQMYVPTHRDLVDTLLRAATCGHEKIIRRIFKEGPPGWYHEAEDVHEESALQIAIMHKHLSKITFKIILIKLFSNYWS